ncbi:MAG: carbohydrate-binding protein, partial [Chloroflexia bacterium]|nr:carbohydrate-binding protein [Chloroflexia bacterium]
YISADGSGTYDVSYRVAAENSAGQIELQLVGDEIASLHTIDLPVTGGWQTWETVTKSIVLPAGQHVLRLLVKKTEFNLNWFEFDLVSNIRKVNPETNQFSIYPNPAKNTVSIISDENLNRIFDFVIISSSGHKVKSGKITMNKTLDLSELKDGVYYLNLYKDNKVYTNKLIIER